MYMSETHRLCDTMHDFTNRVEGGFSYLIDHIAAEHDSGWSSEAMAMIDLANDAKTLRRLADRIESEWRKLIAQPRHHLQAAE